MSTDRPLDGLRVRNLSEGQAATACARLLEHLGAEVHDGGETVRARHDDLLLLDEHSAARQRSSTTLQASLPAGRAAVAITPFGLDATSEDSDREDASGWLGPTVASELAAAHAAAAGLAALRWARFHGSALVVDVAICEMPASCLGDAMPHLICPRAQSDTQGVIDGDRGSRVLVLECADGFFALSGLTDTGRSHLAGLSGADEVLDPHCDLTAALRPWSGGQTRAELFEAAQGWRLPLVPVLSRAEVDEQRPLGSGAGASAAPFKVLAAVSDLHGDRRGGRQHRTRRRAFSPVHPLSDLRVLDLGAVWAGPYAARLLAGLGAEVVKVEAPMRPDGTRPPTGAACAGVFADLNRGKRSLALDLSQPPGRVAFVRLASQADVVIENFSRRVMPNFGLDYATLAAAQPGMLQVSMPAFGSDSPWVDYVAYGSGLELMTGLGMRGPNGRPQAAPIPYLDYLSGTYAAVAVLAWLHHRDTSGEGAHVEVAQWEVARRLLADGVSSGYHGATFAPDPVAIRADPRLLARGLIGAGDPEVCRHYARAPWQIHGLPPMRERVAPGFGADTRAVLREWGGFVESEIKDLVKRGIAVESSHHRPQPVESEGSLPQAPRARRAATRLPKRRGSDRLPRLEGGGRAQPETGSPRTNPRSLGDGAERASRLAESR